MRRDLATLAGGLLMLVLDGCATRCPEPPIAPTPIAAPAPAPAPTPDPRTNAAIDPTLPLCDDLLAEVDGFHRIIRDDHACRAVGVLVLNNFTGKRDFVIDAWPVVVVADQRWLMIESIWLPDTRLAAGTIRDLEGRLVEVAGVLHDQPPGSKQNWQHMPTLAPVTAIRAIDSPAHPGLIDSPAHPGLIDAPPIDMSKKPCPSDQPCPP
jgi:hypothetical protein